MKEVEFFLKQQGINPTPVRMLVYRELRNSQSPKSLSDLEIALDSVDKSTISRTLATFKEKHLIHSFNDGSGSMKYEICHAVDHNSDSDKHIHFRCEKCGITTCFTEIAIPQVSLPKGYYPHEINYVITGICDKCSKES